MIQIPDRPSAPPSGLSLSLKWIWPKSTTENIWTTSHTDVTRHQPLTANVKDLYPAGANASCCRSAVVTGNEKTTDDHLHLILSPFLHNSWQTPSYQIFVVDLKFKNTCGNSFLFPLMDWFSCWLSPGRIYHLAPCVSPAAPCSCLRRGITVTVFTPVVTFLCFFTRPSDANGCSSRTEVRDKRRRKEDGADAKPGVPDATWRKCCEGPGLKPSGGLLLNKTCHYLKRDIIQ